jgi:hypothetical protein
MRGEIFKRLKAALAEFGFGQKFTHPKRKQPLQQKLGKKEPQRTPKNNDLNSDKDKCTGFFEPSNIFNTRNSFFWRLRSLKEWFKELESYEDLRYIKSYSKEI